MEEKDVEKKVEKVENNEEKVINFKNICHTITVYITIAVVTIIAFIFLYSVVLINAYIPSESMENTLMTGDRVIGNRLAYKSSEPERFDIILFKYPDSPSELYIKRLIGLPGEKVTIKDGEVYINDSSVPLDDSFIKEEMEEEADMEFNVPEGHYFMMGDNRNVSHDSRYWNNHYVSEDAIVAKAIFKYWKGFKILK